MISIENISKNYGAKQVLQNVSFRLPAGQVHGIVGENGAGKTTLFKCIAGLESHDGVVKSELNPLKNHLGFLQTDPFFFEKITGREYIQLLRNARNLPQTDIAARNIFDLPLDQYASTYSTGMKKKLALTAVLLQENQVFILDEPFNGVDIHSNILITEIIRQLKALGKTILISSHIFSTLSDTCDEISLLQQNQILRTVPPSGFAQLEQEMRAFTVGDALDRLDLR